MARILRINTRKKTHSFEEPGADLAALGGRGLTSRMVLNEVPPTCHPLSKHNKLVVAPGLLTGTAAANSGRISVGAKSPLTGGIKESNSGGILSQKLARLGIKAVVLEDKPEDSGFSLVVIKKDSVEILPADEYVGLGNNDVMGRLWDTYGKRVGVMSIGPAGQQRLAAACINFADPNGRPGRAAGRGGLGAVMGSKGIKAIVVDDSGAGKVPVADPEAFKTANKRWVEILKGHPVTSQGLPAYGTAILINIINEAGALPTKNFRSGRFEYAQDISGERIAEVIEQRGGKTKDGCHPGCVIQCSNVYHDKDGKVLTSGFEYETIWALGANTTIKDLDDVAMLDALCDDIGLDTIEMGVTLGVAMEAGLIPWGDGKAAIDLLKKVRTGDPLGKIIGNGSLFTGQALGVDRIPVVKRQALPAYDPRAVKGQGVTYCTSPMGADHTAGYAVAPNILKVGGDVDPLKKEGNVEVSKNLQIATAAVDSTGLCLFVAFAVLDTEDGVQTIVDLLNAQYGLSLTPEDVVKLGVSILKDEHTFNQRAGFTKVHDRLPDFFADPLPPHNVTWDYTEEELQQAKQYD
ncbi:MAG: aldehyde ferredoxin oxidoreductase [Deltaproteobacteria bacterium]|nr:aldehyde ferredoxin oxidoreductase [Deltaproteobacteria bacterium]